MGLEELPDELGGLYGFGSGLGPSMATLFEAVELDLGVSLLHGPGVQVHEAFV